MKEVKIKPVELEDTTIDQQGVNLEKEKEEL